MNNRDSEYYELVRNWALEHGIDSAIEKFQSLGIISEAQAKGFRTHYMSGIEAIGEGGPVIKRRHEGWYPGAQESDPSWKHFVDTMKEEKKAFQIPAVHESSDIIVGLTPDPSKDAQAAKGLVVGFVQSGKTTNFTAVAAKLADRDYRMVIVLAGIHNALRSQTQSRLERYLVPENSGRWVPLTSPDNDFDLLKLNEEKKIKMLNAASQLRSPGKTHLLVVKKNHVVLKKLLNWLSAPAAVEALKNNKVLVIDDEADQASVATRTINPLIRQILGLMPRSTYIGYTATPFANVFIDPKDNDDLYPRDFIYPLPRPEGYFGPEVLFGRDVIDGDGEGDIDGYDMVRIIPEEDEFLYRPKTKDEIDSFIPVLTTQLKEAISWFLLATAARWKRQGPVDSSMLIHTSFQKKVHYSYEKVLNKELERIHARVRESDIETLEQLKGQWEGETAKVPAADWGRSVETFEEILEFLPDVLDDCRIVIDNSESDDRLDYESREHNTVIAVGGNTLSRGITLEGLVSSLFLRPTNTYDTLLQMGRWFGFRTGYEDLPRLWTTDLLRRSFRHLSLVEHEMRTDMEVYEMQNLTPLDAAVRIRTHPTLRITAKMGAAAPARTSYSGARVQVRFYNREDADLLEHNWNVGASLVQEARRVSKDISLQGGSILYRNVPVTAVLKFFDEYQILPDQSDVDAVMIKKYISERLEAEHQQLSHWNVVIRVGEGIEGEFAGHDIKLVNRAPLGQPGLLTSVADIGTLMVPQDLVLDIPDISVKEARARGEAGMKMLRADTKDVKDKGLIVLYPINKNSKPTTKNSQMVRTELGAPHHILGLGIVFPRANFSASERASVRSTHLSVDVSEFAEEVDPSEAVFKE